MHSGEIQLLVSKFIFKLLLQPSPNLCAELNPEWRVGAKASYFCANSTTWWSPWPWLSPSETVIKLKHLKRKEKSETYSCAQSYMDKLGINPNVLIE